MHLTREKGYMSESLFIKAVDESLKVSNEINFSFFGEQTLHPYFMKFFGYLKDRPRRFRVVLNTNMSLVTNDHFDLFVDMELSDLRVGIDAATEA